MELHERWLADLRSERMKDKLALAEGKITSEEYMDNKEIDLSTLSIQDVYALRSQAKKENNKPLLDKIYLFLNARSGGFGETLESLLAKRRQYKEDLASGKISPAEHQKFLDELQAANNCPIRNNFNQRYGATGRERRFIDAGKLIKRDEKVLVLVPHGTPEELNANSIRFWNLQDILSTAWDQENTLWEKSQYPHPYDPKFTLMDPAFEETRNPTGLIQQEVAKADIVLSLNMYGQWVIWKTIHQELDDRYLWVLEIPSVKLDDLFINNPKEVWVYIDHRLGHTNDCENLYHAFADRLAKVKPGIVLHLMSGHPSAEWMREQEIVLMAGRFDFFVKHAPQTPHLAKVVPFDELVSADYPLYQHLYFGDKTLTSQCRTEFSREVKPMEPSSDKVWSPVDPNTLMNRE